MSTQQQNVSAGDLSVEGMPCSSTAIKIPADLPLDRWESALRTVGRMARGWQWWVGDLLVHAGKRYGETYDAATAATGLSPSTLKNLKWVATRFPPDARREDWTWSVHRDLASHPKPQPTPGGTPKPTRDRDAASEWRGAGMPEYRPQEPPFKLVVSCETEDDLGAAWRELGQPTVHQKNGRTSSVWYPDRPRDDVSSVAFVEEES